MANTKKTGKRKPDREKRKSATTNETREWIVNYDESPFVSIAGWQVKEAAEPYIPVAVVPEPIGGKKINGRSPRQMSNALLIKAAPSLLRAAQKTLAFINDLQDSNPGYLSKLALQDYARFNAVMIELPQAIVEAISGMRKSQIENRKSATEARPHGS